MAGIQPVSINGWEVNENGSVRFTFNIGGENKYKFGTASQPYELFQELGKNDFLADSNNSVTQWGSDISIRYKNKDGVKKELWVRKDVNTGDYHIYEKGKPVTAYTVMKDIGENTAQKKAEETLGIKKSDASATKNKIDQLLDRH